MTSAPNKPPALNGSSFNCPRCRAFARQQWSKGHVKIEGAVAQPINDLRIAICSHCNQYSLWVSSVMVWPSQRTVEPPNGDLPDDIREDYLEAADVVERSPRSAAALLRLALQKLCAHLGKPGKNINDDIASLVKDGLPPTIQQALDLVRITGNSAVHPGELKVDDDPELASAMFGLLNLIADNRISQPKRLQALWERMPQGARDQVARRDAPKD